MIVITTPTGGIGQQVLENVIERGEAVRVIARDPARLAPQLREAAEIVEGSHGDSDVLDRAFDGADSVFWLVPPSPESGSNIYVDFSRPACAAFERHGVKRVVGVSALGRGTAMAHNAGLVTGTLAMDDLIVKSGVSYRALTLPSFMDNMLRQVEPIKSKGMFFSPLPGDRKFPTCATRDIAAAAASLLLDHGWSGNDSVAVLGPEDLSLNDMAQIMSEVLGKPIRFQQISYVAFKAGLIERGMSEVMGQAVVDMYVAKGEGLDNATPRTPQSTSPTGFRQWCEEVLKPAVLG